MGWSAWPNTVSAGAVPGRKNMIGDRIERIDGLTNANKWPGVTIMHLMKRKEIPFEYGYSLCSQLQSAPSKQFRMN